MVQERIHVRRSKQRCDRALVHLFLITLASLGCGVSLRIGCVWEGELVCVCVRVGMLPLPGLLGPWPSEVRVDTPITLFCLHVHPPPPTHTITLLLM